MSHIRQLYALQEIDLEIDARRNRTEALEAQLTESEELIQARGAVETQEDLLARLEKQQQELEWTVDDLSSKLKPEEKKLYDGSVKNIKELTALQMEVENRQKHKRELEDQVLDIMTALEQTTQELEHLQQTLDDKESAWESQQKDIRAELGSLGRDLLALGQRREAVVGEIPQSLLNLYESVRVSRGGVAVVKVERGMCQGCRITLPTSDLQRARTGDMVVQCTSCARFLYVS
jgi:predicted  nucleic acid-binding Zn-ribbon protein